MRSPLFDTIPSFDLDGDSPPLIQKLGGTIPPPVMAAHGCTCRSHPVSLRINWQQSSTMIFFFNKKINSDYYVNSLLPKLIEDCELLMPDFISSKMALQLTHHVRHKNGWNGIAQTSSRRMSGRRIRQISTHWTSTSGVPCWRNIDTTLHSQQARTSSRPYWNRSGTTYRNSQLRRPSCRSERDFRCA